MRSGRGLPIFVNDLGSEWDGCVCRGTRRGLKEGCILPVYGVGLLPFAYVLVYELYADPTICFLCRWLLASGFEVCMKLFDLRRLASVHDFFSRNDKTTLRNISNHIIFS